MAYTVLIWFSFNNLEIVFFPFYKVGNGTFPKIGTYPKIWDFYTVGEN